MNRLSLVIGLLIANFVLHAQETDSSRLMSLDECIQYAFDNQIDVQNSKLDVENANMQKKEAIGAGLPQVNGQMQFVNNVEIQKQFLPANAFNPAAPSDQIEVVGFGVRYNNNLSITGQQLIFDGSYIAGVKASKTYIELFSKSLTRTKVDVVENVTKAYYGVLVAFERVKLLESDEKNIEELIEDTRISYRNGLAEEIDVQRLEVNLNNVLVEKAKFESFRDVSYKVLKFQMGMELNEPLVIEADLRELYEGVVANALAEENYENRIEYKVLQSQLKVDELNVHYNQSFKMPRLAAFATLGTNTGQLAFAEVPKPGNYEGYGLVGLQLDVPIFSGFSKNMKIGQAKIAQMKTEKNIELFKQSSGLEVVQAKADFDVSQQRIGLEIKSVELARNVKRISQIKYNEGAASSYELTDAISDATSAESNLYFSVYDALIAYTDLQKALGTLYTE